MKIFLYLTILLFSFSVYIQCYNSDLYEINLVKNVVLKTFSYSASKHYPYYRFYNSNGDFLEDGWNSFLQLNGNANFLQRFNFNYRFQIKNFDYVYFQYLNFGYKNDFLSLTYGMDSVWIGHGYHGSLMLSNNATPFRMIRFQTEKPIKIPYIGWITYRFIHGWLDNFKLLAHRFSYMPINFIELGVNQTVVYKQKYKLLEFFKVFTASEENIPGQRFDNDQRASLDIALHFDFIAEYVPFIKSGKIYFEYAGEDLFAWWQKEDKIWIGPLGFEFFDPAQSYGLQINFNNGRFTVEYSQNYKIINLFRNVHIGASFQNLTKKWYRKVPFVQDKFFVGHHMGSESSDFFAEYFRQFKYFGFRIFYHSESHGFASSYGNVYEINSYPEILTEFGFEINKPFRNLDIAILFIINNYNNIDVNSELLEYVIQKNKHESTSTVGLKIMYNPGY